MAAGVAAKHAINLHMIVDLFENDTNNLKREENAYQSRHVKSFTFNTLISPHMIKATVWASMRKKTYNVEVSTYIIK